jgi:hypothetical protein
MSVNVVIQGGRVANLALRYDTAGKPELRFTLDQEEHGFHLYLPCCALGSAAERLAEEINDGDHIVITSGKLTYKKRATQKYGEMSRMEILVWTVDVLTKSPQDDAAEGGSVSQEGAPAIVAPGGDGEPAAVPSVFDTPTPKGRKPRDPTWQANPN